MIKVLVVARNPEVHALFREIDDSCVFAFVSNLDEALRQLLSGGFGLIVIDLSESAHDAAEIVSWTRKREKTRTTPILFLADTPADLDLLRAPLRGNIDVLTRPYKPLLLRAKISMFAELQDQRESLVQIQQELEAKVRERTDELLKLNEELTVEVQERMRVEESLRESEQRFRNMANNAPVMIWMSNTEREWTYFNQRWTDFTGRRMEYESGYGWTGGIHQQDINMFLDHYSRAYSQHQSLQMEMRLRRFDGQYRWILYTGVPRFTPDGSFAGYIGCALDITERKEMEDQLQHVARHDVLTGLPNRNLFMESLKRAMSRARRTGNYSFALLFMDIDNFKSINDSLGHLVGDHLLVEIAHRLEMSLRPGDTVARFGGDEFAVLLDRVSIPEDAVQIADRIQHDFSAPILLKNEAVNVTVSIGIALLSEKHADGEELLHDADMAMYRAKARGKAQFMIA